ncbi:unnamed protein product [Prorocentrum cordatum]|uniref:PI3K/PI4K catalytic domain-containing protein n=1 Tax=Prorocentrum cordatum TaxID=2364126 RepID=A0ABN9PX09_9DINO|nr:unnamed protein product [Polarella glacialis]
MDRPFDMSRDAQALRALLHEVRNRVEEVPCAPFDLPQPVRLGAHFIAVRAQIMSRMKSSTQPVKLQMWCDQQGGDPVVYLLKEEDVTSDFFAQELIRMMNRVWEDDCVMIGSTYVQALTYQVICIGRAAGLVEWVPQSITLAKLKRICRGDALCRVLDRMNSQKIRSLAASTVAYLVSNYVIGVGDGHFDNVMLTDAGNIQNASRHHVQTYKGRGLCRASL